MPKEETKSDRKIGLVIWRNVIAAIIILSLIVARQVVLQNNISDGIDMSHFINVAGRQRMLSQKISKNAFILSNEDSGLYSGARDEIEKDIKEREDAHIYLSTEQQDEYRTFQFSGQTTQALKRHICLPDSDS